MPQKPEQWIRCDNTHEPIISREDWDAVQSLWKTTTTKKKAVYNPLFTGLLRCADCGAHMNFKPDMNRRKDGTNLQHHAYTCGTYKHKRNRHLVDYSGYCIAYLTENSGGTAYTVEYARQNGLKVVNLAAYLR